MCSLEPGSLKPSLNISYTRLAPPYRPGRLDKRWRTCAVVSSTGAMLNHENGQMIDNADLVVRFNDAPVDGWEKYVGSRTDVRFINDEGVNEKLAAFGANPEERSVTYVVVPINGVRQAVPEAAFVSTPYPVKELYMASPELLVTFASSLTNIFSPEFFVTGQEVIPTSGGTAMSMMLDICDEVLAFGMAASKEDADVPYHYYPPQTAAHFHATFDAEKDLWRHLAENRGGTIDRTGVAIIKGFSQYDCPPGFVPVVIHYPLARGLRYILFIAEVVLALSFVLFVLGVWWLVRSDYQGSAGASLEGQAASGDDTTAGAWPLAHCPYPAYVALSAYTVLLLSTDGAFTSATRWLCDDWCSWEPLHVYGFAEILKALASAVRVWGQAVPDKRLCAELAVRQFVVAGMYAGNAYLVLHIIAKTDAKLYVAWRNLAAPFSLAIWSWWFGRRPSRLHCLAMTAIVVGILLQQVTPDGIWMPLLWDWFPYSFLCVALSAGLASVAALINEDTMKAAHLKSAFSIDSMNMLLYLETAVILGVLSSIRGLTQPSKFMNVLDWVPMGLAVMQAALGLVVSRVLFYADCVAKATVGGLRDVAVALVIPLVVRSRPYYWSSISSAVWMLSGIAVFFAFAHLYPQWPVDAGKPAARAEN